MTVLVDERAYTFSNVPCVICDARLRWTNVDDPDWIVGDDLEIVCHDCFSLFASTCSGCHNGGFAFLDSAGATYWRVYNHMQDRIRGTYGEHWSNAETYCSRIARFAREHRGTLFPIDDADHLVRTMDDEIRCGDCAYCCEDCGEAFANLNDDDRCDSCWMFACDECGERFDESIDAQRCCRPFLRSYDYTPEFRFWRIQDGELASCHGKTVGWNRVAPTNELFLGFELETECGDDSFPAFLDDAGEDAQNPQFVYGKSDGSLDASGVELVTMPATLDAINARFPWRALRMWNVAGARSFHRGTCGFHVHVSRSFFSATHLWRFVAWQMRNQRFCEAIGQRTNSHWAQWQTLRDFGKNDAPTLEDMVKGKDANGSRYVAINFQNEHTIELRYFRGNLREDAIRLRIEFVDALANYTKTIGAGDVLRGALGAGAFVHYCMDNAERYATLARWIMDNEPNGEDA